MTDEQEKTRRCGWIALGFIVFLLQGILPGSLMGGVAGLKAADAVFGQPRGSDLISGFFVLTGMIMGLLVSAVIIMFLTMVVGGISASLLRRSALAASRQKLGPEE